ncbi:Tn3 family transposase [Bacillus safensis]|uniref:Tn3 family transposase n=1 Tax=Bacillus safensis TaxID=561879 RepID=UPI00293CD01A|nr:Tn3 family transposase [Bacillus safensis]MDV3450590.1 Tn3 family transposase [Bacillus safensis]
MDIEKNTTNQNRLKILREEEIKIIYDRPIFTYEDRCQYFFLSQPEKELLDTLRSVKSRVYFILQLGYFKAKHLFFTFDLYEVEEDLQYILQVYFNVSEISDLNSIGRFTRLKQQQLILELFNYRTCDAEERRKMEEKAQKTATFCSKPIYIFREIMNYLSKHRIVVPSYSFMQDMIGKVITHEQNRLIALMQNHLNPSDIEALKRLLEDSSGLYEITRLKHEPKDFSATEIKHEINRGKRIQDLYQVTQKLLPEIGISNESIKYYASLVDYYSVFRLKQLNEWISYVYLLCFVYHRYQRMYDNLINTFTYRVRRYTDEAKSVGKERMYESHLESSQDMKKAGEVLQIFTDDHIPTDTPFQEIQNRAFAILERPKLATIADQIVTNTKLDEVAFRWEHIDQLALQFKRSLRSIFLLVDFAAPSPHDPLIEAVHFMKRAFKKNKPLGQYPYDAFPQQFIPDGMKRYIYPQDSSGQRVLRADRYEFFVYQLLRNGLEAGDIFCRDSIRFRSFEDDLIGDLEWQQKEKLLTDVGLSLFNQPIQAHLAKLEKELEARITEVNQRIESGENKHIQIKKRGSHSRWTLPYTRDSESTNHPFFGSLKSVEIISVLQYINEHCQFFEAFEHVLGRYAKQTREDRILVACLIAWGTNMGLGRMGEISDIDYSTLASTSDNFIRLETLKEASDRISNATAKLPIFQHYNIEEAIHSSSDGRKVETRISTINSRYSPKYFGLKKGIVSYTMVANHIPVNARIIGANEHESHYVFDILYNNTTDIQPDVHSTDTHGTNEVNFAILHFFGYQFAPRYKDIHEKVSSSLYGFKHPSQYGDVLIKPVRKINTKLIMEEWENIQRIMLSLALKTTTQSVIVRKLSSYTRKNKTKRALWEYDNIIKSLYFLLYIDSLTVRRNVQRALNRGESYHQLCKAISYANFGKLRFKTEQDQQIWGECSRLIANCIIYYNASILSNMLTYREKNGQDSEMLKRISPVSWQHINLYGRYEFNSNQEFINMNEIIQELAQSKGLLEKVTNISSE